MNLKIINLIIFIIIFCILYFDFIANSFYLRHFIIIFVILYFSLIDIKYGLIILILYMIQLNNPFYEHFLLNKIPILNKIPFIKDIPFIKSETEEFIGVGTITNALCKTETFKTIKKYVKKKGKELLKSIQEEENIPLSNEDIENFSNKKKKNISLFEQLQKNDALENQLESFQNNITNKLSKINNILTEIKK